jgi:hypothetical protein
MAGLCPHTLRKCGVASRRGEHVIVKNGGHELLPEPLVQDLVAAYLRHQSRPGAIDLEKPEYRRQQ